MKWSTPLRMGFLSVLASLVFVFGMVISTGTVSAHTASAHTAASTQMASSGCGFNQFDCNSGFGNFSDCGFNQFDCNFNNFNSCDFNNCFSSCNENGCIFIPHHFRN